MPTPTSAKTTLSREECLIHYATREPRLFHQLDGFNPPSCPVDDTYDEDGDELFAGTTIEMMTGGPAVRVLVTDGTDHIIAVRLLRKLADWLDRRPDLIVVDSPGRDVEPF